MRWSTPTVLLFVLATSLPAQTPPVSGSPSSRASNNESRSPARQFTDLIPGLIEALKDTDSDVRQHAAMSLATLGPEALKPLIESLQDPVREKRAASAYALGHMGYEGHDAMPALLKTLKDEDPSVRRAAAQAISRIISDEEIEAARSSSRYRGRNTGVLPGLTVPGTQPSNLPPLDPVPVPTVPKNDKRDPPK